MATKPTIWAALADELRPLVVHAGLVGFLDAMLVLLAVMNWLLKWVAPDRKALFDYIELVDIWTALALVSMFAVYTLIVVGLSLYRGIRS